MLIRLRRTFHVPKELKKENPIMITGDKRSDGPEKRKRYDKYDSREVMACLTFRYVISKVV